MLAPSFFAAVVAGHPSIAGYKHKQRAESDAGFRTAAFVRRHRSKTTSFQCSQLRAVCYSTVAPLPLVTARCCVLTATRKTVLDPYAAAAAYDAFLVCPQQHGANACS